MVYLWDLFGKVLYLLVKAWQRFPAIFVYAYICSVLWPARRARHYMFGFSPEISVSFLSSKSRYFCFLFWPWKLGAHLLLFPLLFIFMLLGNCK